MKRYEIHLPIEQGLRNEDRINCVREIVLSTFGSLVVPYAKAFTYDGEKYVEIVKLEFITSGDVIRKKRLKDFKSLLKRSLHVDCITITAHRVEVL